VGFHVTTRWGGDEANPTAERLREVLAQLDAAADDEHPCVSLTHESEWSLGVYSDGLLVWENVEDGEPRHQLSVSREHVLTLWLKLAAGKTDEVEAEPWLPGYA
jgi:hypothetical protein